ncbi:MAG TPA: hypothetical protein VHW44_25000 [Pseudonocardiaceae bacterium]|jgi:hypothetical protein|nr:hypothetical protein [Pseudonocardiaceae bacterium]
MGTLSYPDLPTGPLKQFNDALHELHWQAHRPTVREMSVAIKGTVLASHGRIHDAFTKARLPDWDLTSALVTELAKRAPGRDPAQEIHRFHQLSLAASGPTRLVEPLTSTDPEPVIEDGIAAAVAVHEVVESELVESVIEPAEVTEPAHGARSIREQLLALGIWPAGAAEQLGVVSLALQWLGLGLAIGLGRGLADDFSSPVSYGTIAAGVVFAVLIGRRLYLPVGAALTGVLLIGTWLVNTVLDDKWDKINSALAGLLVGMAVWRLFGIIRKSVDQLAGQGIGSTWLGVLMAMFLAIGFLIAWAMDAGHGNTTSSVIWTGIAGAYIGVGVILANRREGQP